MLRLLRRLLFATDRTKLSHRSGLALTRGNVWFVAEGKLLLCCLTLICALLLSGTLPAWGQAPAPEMHDPLKLTMKDAVLLALQQNLDLQVATLNAATRQQERQISRSDLLPQASLQAVEEIQRYNLEALIGLQFAGVAKDVGPFQSFRAGARFSSPIFDLTLIRRYQASGHLLLASKDDVVSTREQTVLLTVSQYLACLRAEAQVKAAQSRVQLATDLAKQAEDLLAAGVATQIDVSRASVSLIGQKQRLIDAQSEVQTAGFGLKRILNLPDAEPADLTDTNLFTQTPEINFSDTVAMALDQRAELQSLSAQVDAASLEHKAAIANSLPTLTVNGGWNQQGRTFGSLHPGYDYEATFNVPLFSGGRLTAERKTATLEEQRRSRQLQDARNRVTEQVRDDQVELEAARGDVGLGQQQVKLAHDEVTLAQGRFSAGVTDNIEVTTAQDELARANDVEIAAFYRYNIARANLARAVGSIELVYTRP